MHRFATYTLFAAILAITGCRTQPVASGEEQEPAAREAKLLFAGDIMCHTPQINAARNGEDLDFSKTFEFVKPLFEEADATIVNFETVVSPDGNYSGYPTFSSPEQLAWAIKQAGIDIVVMANNHCCDRGAPGIRSTTRCFDSLGIARTGSFADHADYVKNRILRFNRNGIDFALLNYTYGTNGIRVPEGCVVNLIDTLAMARDIAEICDADCRIVFLHWGNEYEHSPSSTQLQIKDFLQRKGVEIIIGSHPHVIQPATAAGNRVFVSSLGNFVSNQRKRFCDGGLMAEVDVAEVPEGGFEYHLTLIPVWVRKPHYQILTPDAADTVLTNATERALYRQFIDDTEKLLYDGKFVK